MDPNTATAPAPNNLMRDIAPPSAAQPAEASIPVAHQAPQSTPAQRQAPSQPAPAQIQPAEATAMPAQPTNLKDQPAARTAHEPKVHAPVLVISLAMIVAAALIVAAWIAYRQSI